MAHDHVEELVDTVKEVVRASLDEFFERAGCTRTTAEVWELVVESMAALEDMGDDDLIMPGSELRDLLLALSVLLGGWAA